MRAPDRAAPTRCAWSVLVTLLAAGCSLLNTVELPSEVSDANAEACELALPPDPPAAPGDAEPSKAELDLVFALRTSDYGDADDADGVPRYRRIGYDLDGRCTRGLEERSCTPHPSASDIDDGEGGRDNAAGRLTYELAGIPFFSDQATELARVGSHTALIRLRRYNGEQDDDEVEVAIYVGTTWTSPAESRAPDWDGSDRWHVSTLWVEGEADHVGAEAASLPPRYLDARAYVVDGAVVARFERVPPGNAFTSVGDVLDVLLVSPIAREGSQWTLRKGIFAGRRTVEQLALSLNTPTSNGPPPCPDPKALARTIDQLCAYADLRIDDDTHKPCNVLSIAQQFDADQARLGDVFEAVPAPSCLTEQQRAVARCEP